MNKHKFMLAQLVCSYSPFCWCLFCRWSARHITKGICVVSDGVITNMQRHTLLPEAIDRMTMFILLLIII